MKPKSPLGLRMRTSIMRMKAKLRPHEASEKSVTYCRNPQLVGGRRMKLSLENESSTTTTLGASMKRAVAVKMPA